MIRFVDVDPDNWRLGLKVAPSQKTHVADSATLLARAYAYRDRRSRAFVIYDEETPVGMGLYYDLPEMECYDFSQLFIDERPGQGVRQGCDTICAGCYETGWQVRQGCSVLCGGQ